jgi:hypothetical protein
MRRLSIVSVLALLTLTVMAAPAYAAAPSNDEPSTATVISALPTTITEDTTEATYTFYGGCTSADAAANVWFTFTPTADVRVDMDATASSYHTGLNVFAHQPGDANLVTCSESSLRFDAAAGVTYYLEVAACCGSSTGGQLVLSLSEAAIPPTVTVTVDPTGHFDAATGSATISGTATCSSSVDTALVEAFVSQKVGRVATVTGQNGIFVGCEPGGGPAPWSVTVQPGSGEFRGGPATVSIQSGGCNELECSFTYTDAQVRLVH